ncbi:TonB-dependent receptor [Pelagicoccus mobilis]|uniref:TonB-dependent receptor n=1 Tax=Pelagicoccus mobilis TaxID=415221 RepID=A0A934VT60_9BACT|nr:TonB-dependent receptor [Pelagicoccus mobilis]MBK1879184.1 TonB-dependent receptor [Pelagicoccus mobilis]
MTPDTNRHPNPSNADGRKALLASLALGLLTAPLFAQEEEEDQEIFELSPFSVQAEEGWVATETLAGSRLKSSFRDVATQIETMTTDFMDDFSLNSVEETLIYSVNVANTDDYISGNGGGFGSGQIRNFSQIRGLGGGTLSRNFFRSNMPTDNYNLSRVTIASGPNSILFGTGSPAGVLDVTLNRANLVDDEGTVKVEFDSFESRRMELDYNKILIDDRLAFRFAILDEDDRQEFEPNFDRERRYYGTFMFKPWERGSISVHYEDSERKPNRINRFLPFDEVSPWFNAGKPGFDNSTASWGDLDDIYNRGGHQPVLVVNPDGSWGQAMSFRNTATVKGPEDLSDVHPLDVEADGWTLLDDSIFPSDLNLAGVAGSATFESEHTNIFFEQQLAKNWFIEVAYNNEDTHEHRADPGIDSRTLNVDPNMYMPDGVTPNPNFGDFYVQGRGNYFEAVDSIESWRAAMSYELDFTERDGWVSFFGRQRAGVLFSEETTKHIDQQGNRYRWLPDENGNEPYFPDSSFASRLSDSSRDIQTRYYLNETNGYTAVAVDGAWDGSPMTFVDEAGTSWLIDPINNGLFNADGARLSGGNGTTSNWQELETLQFSYQGYFWDDRLILTYGYRDDEAQGKGLLGSVRDNSTRFFPYWKDLEWAEEFREPQGGITRTTGVVARPIEWLSLYYNESDTFQPNIGKFSPYGNEYPGAEGTGEDVGIRFDVLKGRLSIKWNRFENTAGPSRAANTPFNRWRDPVWSVENRWRNLVGGDPDYPGKGEGGFRENGRANYWVMSDATAEGDEITVQANPIDGLNLRFTYSDQEAIESNIGLDWFNYIAERLPVWETLNVPEGGADDPRDMNGDGNIGTWTWDTAWFNNNNPEGSTTDGNRTLSEYYEEITIKGPSGAEVISALDGKSNEFERNKRWNLNASYRLQDGKFKGTTIGGAIRWRDSPLIGYGSTVVNGEDIIDLSTPYRGDDEIYLDLMAAYRGKLKAFGDRNYKIQLNLKNALDEDGDIPVIKSITGAPLRMARVEGRRITVGFELDI